MIVIGVDASPPALEALRYGIHEASIRGTRVRVVHAWSPSMVMPATGPGMLTPVDMTPYETTASELLRTTVASVAGDAADRIERILVEGPAGPAIVDHARDAELIVVGRRGIGAVHAFVLGSVSSYVTAHATCPVLVVPAAKR